MLHSRNHYDGKSYVLQHRLSEADGMTTAFAGLINGTTFTYNNTPIAADNTTEMGYGGKVGAAKSNNIFSLDALDQFSAADTDALAWLNYNSSATAAHVQGAITQIEIDGMTRYRLNMAFYNATGGTTQPIATLLGGTTAAYEVIVTFKGSSSQ